MAEEKSYDTSENEYVGKASRSWRRRGMVTMDGDKMSAIEVLEQSETPDIGGKALESLPQTVLDAQSVDVDAVSGATTTSKGFFAAVTEALGQASKPRRNPHLRLLHVALNVIQMRKISCQTFMRARANRSSTRPLCASLPYLAASRSMYA